MAAAPDQALETQEARQQPMKANSLAIQAAQSLLLVRLSCFPRLLSQGNFAWNQESWVDFVSGLIAHSPSRMALDHWPGNNVREQAVCNSVDASVTPAS